MPECTAHLLDHTFMLGTEVSIENYNSCYPAHFESPIRNHSFAVTMSIVLTLAPNPITLAPRSAIVKWIADLTKLHTEFRTVVD